MRAGARVLLMATDPIKREILRTVLGRVVELSPGELYGIGPEGRQALFVGFSAERWLHSAPQGPLPFDSPEGEAAIVALAEGWSTTAIHALAREPLTFRELHQAVENMSRRALKRHLKAMQDAGQVEVHPEDGGEDAVYTVTDWLRAGIAPLIAAARIELRTPMAGAEPIDVLDVYAGFLLSLSLISLPPECTGVCKLGINLGANGRSGLTGVTTRIEQGQIVAIEPGIEGKANAWAAGPIGEWLDTVIEPDAKSVRTGGDRWLAQAVLDALHKTLFGVPVA
jgi:DNA-binding HxlR family transcriptional regulator